MKIHISEKDMPKNKDFKCKGCEFIEHISATQKVCKLTGTHGHGNNGDCPLQSLEQHDNEVRREFAEKITNAICGLDKCRGWTDEHQGYKSAKRHAVFAIDDLLKQYEVEE